MTITVLCLTATLAAPPTEAPDAGPGEAIMDEVPAPSEPVDADEAMEEALPEEAEVLERDMERSRARIRSDEAQEKTAAHEHRHEHPPAAESGDSKEEGHTHGLMEERYGSSPAKAGEKKETGDWADEGRWQRYKKRNPSKARPGALANEPEVFRRRQPGVAFTLGALVGFGAGQYYAGENRSGLIFSGIDAVLVIGFVATTVALNRLVIEHDFRSGKSLARGDREFGKREERLYVASALFALGLVGTHIWQGVWSMRAARRTNARLQSVSVAPTQGGGAVLLTFGY
jgi:hypothetical protein